MYMFVYLSIEHLNVFILWYLSLLSRVCFEIHVHCAISGNSMDFGIEKGKNIGYFDLLLRVCFEVLFFGNI